MYDHDFLERAKKSIEASVDYLEEYYDYLRSFPEKAVPGSLDKITKAIDTLHSVSVMIDHLRRRS